jgi:hypothetical protein
METVKKAVENRKAPFEVEGKAGGRVISLRVTEKMEQLLEEQAQEWNMSISDTLRGILNFYFLPPVLYEAWEKKVQELIDLDTEQKGENRADMSAPTHAQRIELQNAQMGEMQQDMSAPTHAQRIEPVFCDSEEAEEYANFIHELWDKNLRYWEILREEAVTANRIAVKQLTETAEALKRCKYALPERAEVEP